MEPRISQKAHENSTAGEKRMIYDGTDNGTAFDAESPVVDNLFRSRSFSRALVLFRVIRGCILFRPSDRLLRLGVEDVRAGAIEEKLHVLSV